VPPGASRGGAERGCSKFLATRNMQKNLSSVEAGMGRHERTNHVHRKMHSSKCTEIDVGWGSFKHSPDLLAGFKTLYF